MSDDCPTCSGTGLVEPTEEYNAGGLGWARCPDCEPPPPDPRRLAELRRIHEIQSNLLRVTEATAPSRDRCPTCDSIDRSIFEPGCVEDYFLKAGGDLWHSSPAPSRAPSEEPR